MIITNKIDQVVIVRNTVTGEKVNIHPGRRSYSISLSYPGISAQLMKLRASGILYFKIPVKKKPKAGESR